MLIVTSAPLKRGKPVVLRKFAYIPLIELVYVNKRMLPMIQFKVVCRFAHYGLKIRINKVYRY